MIANTPALVDKITARQALVALDNLAIGGCLKCSPLQNLPAVSEWVLVSKEKVGNLEVWMLKGSVCGIPFYQLDVFLENNEMSLHFQEEE